VCPRGGELSGDAHCQVSEGLVVNSISCRETERVRRMGIGECGNELILQFLETAGPGRGRLGGTLWMSLIHCIDIESER
jgi:hypothetical protein